MDGLTQSYTFKERLLKCKPIDLSRFAVELRERQLEYWAPLRCHLQLVLICIHKRATHSAPLIINGTPPL